MKKSKLISKREESFALTIGEALASGLPVICYDIPPVREFYQTESVLCCHVGDVNCVVKKTLKLLLEEELRKRLSIKARIYIRKFKWEENVEKEFRLYSYLAYRN